MSWLPVLSKIVSNRSFDRVTPYTVHWQWCPYRWRIWSMFPGTWYLFPILLEGMEYVPWYLIPVPVTLHGYGVCSLVLDTCSLQVEGMEYVPWYFGCRYSCQICQKVWHYPQACRYHLDSVHKLSRAQYEVRPSEYNIRYIHTSALVNNVF